jgi:hypothetical protein
VPWGTLLCYFTLSNARVFYLSRCQRMLALDGLNDRWMINNIIKQSRSSLSNFVWVTVNFQKSLTAATQWFVIKMLSQCS